MTAEPRPGTCWFCRRVVPWDTLIAGYDTWDEARLACNTCNDAIRWMNSHGFVFSRAALPVPALDALRLERAMRKAGFREVTTAEAFTAAAAAIAREYAALVSQERHRMDDRTALPALEQAMGTLANEAVTVMAGLRAQGFVILQAEDASFGGLRAAVLEMVHRPNEPEWEGWNDAIHAVVDLMDSRAALRGETP